MFVLFKFNFKKDFKISGTISFCSKTQRKLNHTQFHLNYKLNPKQAKMLKTFAAFCFAVTICQGVSVYDNQTFYVFGSACPPLFPNSCTIQTGWNPDTKTMVFTPTNCLSNEVQICQEISLKEYMSKGPEFNWKTLEKTFLPYIPDPRKDLLPLECTPTGDGKDYFRHLLAFNGKAGVTFHPLALNNDCWIGANNTNTSSLSGFSVSGAVLSPTANETEIVDIKGLVRFYNFLVQGHTDQDTFQKGTFDFSVSQITINADIYIDVTFTCNFVWMGFKFEASDCHVAGNSGIPDQYLTLAVFDDGFTFLDIGKTCYVFKTRETLGEAFENQETRKFLAN